MKIPKPIHAYNADCPSCTRELRTTRYWKGGSIRAMGICAGWVMARKLGAAPFVLTWREWLNLPKYSGPNEK